MCGLDQVSGAIGDMGQGLGGEDSVDEHSKKSFHEACGSFCVFLFKQWKCIMKFQELMVCG